MSVLVDIPLILGDDNVVRYDHRSWAWMIYVLGEIKMPSFQKNLTHDHDRSASYWHGDADSLQHRFKEGYRDHIPPSGHSIERDYSAIHIDMLNYRGMQCGLHEHIPLNFHSGWDNAL